MVHVLATTLLRFRGVSGLENQKRILDIVIPVGHPSRMGAAHAFLKKIFLVDKSPDLV